MFHLTAQIFSILLAAIVVSKSYVDFRARRESLQMFAFWLLTWTGVLLVALRPTIIDYLIAVFGGQRTGLGTVFGMGLVFLFFLVYRMYVRLERIEQKLVKTIQDIALQQDWKNRKQG